MHAKKLQYIDNKVTAVDKEASTTFYKYTVTTHLDKHEGLVVLSLTVDTHRLPIPRKLEREDLFKLRF